MQESIVFSVRVQCRCKESSRSLSHLLMSFLYILLWILYETIPEMLIMQRTKLYRRSCDGHVIGCDKVGSCST